MILIIRLKYQQEIWLESLSKKGYTKTSKTSEILCCSYEYFKSHIESLFDYGMTWDNRNLWHIDHIIPLDFAENEEEMLMLNHYSNLSPLWRDLNLEKSSKILEHTNIYLKILQNRK